VALAAIGLWLLTALLGPRTAAPAGGPRRSLIETLGG
jgi:hypothetical protein